MARKGESSEEVCSDDDYVSQSETEEHLFKPLSDEEEDSGSEAEPKSEPDEEESKATKPVEHAKNGSARKRPAEGEGDAAAAPDAKKSKTTDHLEVKSNSLFQRVWSEKDEIAILQGMVDYASQKKGDPVSNLAAFLDFIKPKLHFTRSQVQDKIRRLKKKFENNKSRKKDGKPIMSSNPHELKSYELSKLIWGGKENGNNSGDVQRLKSNSKSIPVVGAANAEERVLIAAQSLGLEGKEEWEKLKERELELYLKQLELKVAQTKLVLADMKK